MNLICNIFLSLLLLRTVLCQPRGARNIRIAPNGRIIATQVNVGLLLSDGDNTSVQSLPPGISNLDDISISTEGFVFALSTRSRAVCSYEMEEDSLTLIGCQSNDNFAVSPFCGVSARDGTLLISGGTGGLTVYDYDIVTGIIQGTPRFRNIELPSVIGHPDGELVSGSLAALSTDFSGSGSRFGTMMVDLSGNRPVQVGDFRVTNSLGFSLTQGTTNFPLVNSFYRVNSIIYMYTANGAITAQNIENQCSSNALASGINGFRAVTCSVDASREVLVVGGLSGSQSFVVEFDLASDPLNPEMLTSQEVTGRITSVATDNGAIAYVGNDFSQIEVLRNSAIPIDLCFSGETKLQTSDNNFVKMKDLQIGQQVRNSKTGGVDTFYGWAHVDRKTIVDFLKITFDNSQETIEVTPNHLVFLKGHPITASKLRVGDSMAASEESKIKNIELVQRKGLYAPLTTSGRVSLVLGVQASCYATINTDHGSYLMLSGLFEIPVTFHTLGHLWFTPYRIMHSHFGINYASNESLFLEWSLSVSNMLNHGSALCNAVTLMLLIPLFIALAALEYFMDHQTLAFLCVMGITFAIKIQQTKMHKSNGSN